MSLKHVNVDLNKVSKIKIELNLIRIEELRGLDFFWNVEHRNLKICGEGHDYEDWEIKVNSNGENKP